MFTRGNCAYCVSLLSTETPNETLNIEYTINKMYEINKKTFTKNEIQKTLYSVIQETDLSISNNNIVVKNNVVTNNNKALTYIKFKEIVFDHLLSVEDELFVLHTLSVCKQYPDLIISGESLSDILYKQFYQNENLTKESIQNKVNSLLSTFNFIPMYKIVKVTLNNEKWKKYLDSPSNIYLFKEAIDEHIDLAFDFYKVTQSIKKMMDSGNTDIDNLDFPAPSPLSELSKKIKDNML